MSESQAGPSSPTAAADRAPSAATAARAGREGPDRNRAQASVDRAMATAERGEANQIRTHAAAARTEALAIREQARALREASGKLREEAARVRDAAHAAREEAAQARLAALKARAEASASPDVAPHRSALELAHRAMVRSQEATARDRDAALSDRLAAERDGEAANHDARATAREREAAEDERRASALEKSAAERERLAAASDQEAAHQERRGGRERARAADVLASLRTLAAGIVHQVNDPLSAVLANVAFARGELEKAGSPDAPEALAHAAQALGEAVSAAEHIRDTVRAVRTWASPASEEPSRGPVAVARLLDEALQRVPEPVRGRVRREEAEVPPVDGVAPQLGQVVAHLLTNALQAVPDGAPDRGEVRVRTRLEAALGMVVIEVADAGDGIPPEVLPRVFDPFFTTRALGHAGLGLSICQGIVHAHGGELAVESELGRGTTVQVMLPVAAPPRSEVPAPPPPPRGKVLVIDDDRRVAESMARLLALDHEVSIALAGPPALEMLAAEPEAYDVVLCDLKMPSMGGIELYGELAKVDPELARRLIFITGGTLPESTQAFLRERGLLLLEKPVDVGALAGLVRRRVNARRGAPGEGAATS